MIKTVIYSTVILCFVSIGVAQIKTKPRTPIKNVPFGPKTDDLYKLTEGIDQFSMQLLIQAIKDSGEKNLVISPFSVWSLLTLLSEGAAGETLSEMVSVLRHTDKDSMRKSYKTIDDALSTPDKMIQLEMNNDVFTAKDIQLADDYLNLAKTLYKSNITSVDFENKLTLGQMNKIIEKATHGKITNAFKESDLMNALVILSNTIYFNGKWTIPFDKSHTSQEPFLDNEDREIGKVNMMMELGPFSNKYFSSLDSDIVEIPYGEVDCYDFYDVLPQCVGERKRDYKPRYSMYAVVPFGKISLDELLNRLSKTSIRKLYEDMEENPMKNLDPIELQMPRFKMSSDLQMKDILKTMGMNKAFDSASANFSVISPKRSLVLSKVCHKAMIEVTEEGTEAAAVTTGILIDRITPDKIKMNKPFVYMIVEKLTKTILFIGTYGKPSLF